MTPISSTDILMVRATLFGTELASFASSGFSSISEVVSAARLHLGAARGTIELALRNSSQGWTARRAIRL